MPIPMPLVLGDASRTAVPSHGADVPHPDGQMPGRIDAIQALRGLAAVIVVLNHVWVVAVRGSGGASLGDLIRVERFGLVGVDIFFCISGFIMVRTLRAGGGRLRQALDFTWRRVRRIYPPYLACLGIFVLLGMLPCLVGRSPKGFIASLSAYDWARNALLLPTWPGDTVSRMALPQAWTLVYEMYFYVLFAACLLVAGQRRVGWVMPLALCAVICLFRYGVGPGERNTWTNASYIVADPLCLDFALGCLLALASVRLAWRARTTRSLLACAMGAVALLAVALYGPSEPRLLWGGLPAVLLVALGAVCVLPRGPRWRWPVALGEASYAIYLVHVFVPMAILMTPVLPRVLNDVAALVLSGFAVALGWAFHVRVERPLQGGMPLLREMRLPRPVSARAWGAPSDRSGPTGPWRTRVTEKAS